MNRRLLASFMSLVMVLTMFTPVASAQEMPNGESKGLLSAGDEMTEEKSLATGATADTKTAKLDEAQGPAIGPTLDAEFTDASAFQFNASTETITGLTEAGKQLTEINIPAQINSVNVTALEVMLLGTVGI